MKRRWIILIVALTLAGGLWLILELAPDRPELTLTFKGFETNGQARFVISNHSGRRIDFCGPLTRNTGSRFTTLTLYSMDYPLSSGTAAEISVMPHKGASWQAFVIYERPHRFSDDLRLFLRDRLRIRFVNAPSYLVQVTSTSIPNK
jgi:hypothetical protein